jgi:YjbE family integral membrane protein
MEGLLKLVQIVLLDIVLSGDNAVIVGAKAATLPAEQRKKAIFYGMSMAVVFRVVFSLFATYLVTIPGLRFLGGLALVWVAYGMWNDLKDNGEEDGSSVAPAGNFRSALMAIAVADISMSIDNVLAVAGAAEGHFLSLAFGLVLSIAIMMFAANAVARLIQKWHWIAWIGLVLVIYIAGKLIVEDWPNVVALFN